MSDALRDWLKSGKYLPPILRDFHDQKDFFKFMDERVRAKVKKDTEERNGLTPVMFEGYNWVLAHVLVIDFFLWYMAMNGYTLQKCRQKLPFRDYAETIAKAKEDYINNYPLLPDFPEAEAKECPPA